MNKLTSALAAVFVFTAYSAQAQMFVEEEEVVYFTPAKHEQRILSRRTAQAEAQAAGCALERMWATGKNTLNKLNMDIGVDVSYLAQRVSPNGKQTAIQGVYYPYMTWNLFKDRALGSGQLNVNYTLVRYWGTAAALLQDRANLATPFNDYPANQEIFSQASYTHTLPGEFNWLSLTVGQFPLYNFDGTSYVANQQTGLMNYAMSQNATSAYPSASFGAYMQAQGSLVSLAAGYQDATNISGEQIRLKDAFDGKYTAFGSLSLTPKFDMGAGQYSFMMYYQPAVDDQPENVTGWSFNMQQALSEQWVVFGRANGSNHGVTGIKNSYVLGAAFLNPLKRNTQDAIVLGLAYNNLSAQGLGYPNYVRHEEMTMELQWTWGIGQLITITPDLQVSPKAGLNADQKLTTVIGLRTNIML